MSQGQEELKSSSGIDWTCTALAVAAFFAYILVIAFDPELFRQPVAEGTLLSIGIVSGVLLSIFLVVLAGIYSWLRNRSDSE